jgi:hypothetical protein
MQYNKTWVFMGVFIYAFLILASWFLALFVRHRYLWVFFIGYITKRFKFNPEAIFNNLTPKKHMGIT